MGFCLDFCLFFTVSHFSSRCVFVSCRKGCYNSQVMYILLLTSWGSFKMTGALLKWSIELLTWNSLQEPSASTISKSLCTQFSQYLHENASYVRPLEEGMLHLFESITEDTVTVLVRFLGFYYWKRFLQSKHTYVVFFLPGNSCEIEGLLRTFSFLLMLSKKDSSLSVKKVLLIW